ncbi:unnamed protein product [Polarella glacialis]|uniref:Uncharacterized protein n=1 Tax=Polarella glacialis TaxID=89957 RepID=A0A813I0G4_POLGL|nr:unnamed protein product [Polarella glacialis]
MANTFFAGKGMANAMGHQVLAEKYKAEHREAEGAEEQRLFEQAALQPSIMLCCVFFAQGPILIGSLILGVYGLMQAIKADNESCASGKLVFWVLSVLNLLSQLSQVARARENMQQLEAERLNQPADGAGAYTQAPTVDVPLPASNPPGNEEPICASNPTSNF